MFHSKILTGTGGIGGVPYPVKASACRENICCAFLRRAGLLSAAAGVLLGTPVAFAGALDGRWRHIGDESDDIRKQVIERLEYVDKQAARMIDTPQGRRVVGVRTVRPDVETVDRFMSWLDGIAPPRSLEQIRTGEGGVTLIYADGRTREICTDCGGKRVSIQSTANEGPQKLVIAAWEGESLTIETNTNTGLSVLEVYRRPESGKFLYIEYTIDANRFSEPIHATQVYAPAGRGGAAE